MTMNIQFGGRRAEPPGHPRGVRGRIGPAAPKEPVHVDAQLRSRVLPARIDPVAIGVLPDAAAIRLPILGNSPSRPSRGPRVHPPVGEPGVRHGAAQRDMAAMYQASPPPPPAPAGAMGPAALRQRRLVRLPGAAGGPVAYLGQNQGSNSAQSTARSLLVPSQHQNHASIMASLSGPPSAWARHLQPHSGGGVGQHGEDFAGAASAPLGVGSMGIRRAAPQPGPASARSFLGDHQHHALPLQAGGGGATRSSHGGGNAIDGSAHLRTDAAPQALGDFGMLKAFACALVEASGSLDAAFQRLDLNNSGKVSRTQWDTGLALLHIDVAEACGRSSKALFLRMSKGGEVAFDAWTEFFRPLLEDPSASNAVEEAAERFKQRQEYHEHLKEQAKEQKDQQDILRKRSKEELLPAPTEGQESAQDTTGYGAGAETEMIDGEGASATSTAETVACALVEICGSLDVAWQRLDHAKTGRVSRADFYLGLSDLGLDVEHECGITANSIFQKLSRAGEITMDSWGAFFRKDLESQRAMDALADAEKRFQQNRAAQGSIKAQRRSKGFKDTKPMDKSGAGGSARRNSGGASGSDETTAPALAQGQAPAGHDDPALPPMEAMVALQAALSNSEREELRREAQKDNEALYEEIAELSLEGIEAIAYVLIAKLGSLKRAFKWFNSTNTGHVANVSWDTGVSVLHLDLQKIAGVDSAEVFRKLDRSSTGTFDRGDWHALFSPIEECLDAETLAKLRDRASNFALARVGRSKIGGLQLGAHGRTGSPNTEDEDAGDGSRKVKALKGANSLPSATASGSVGDVGVKVKRVKGHSSRKRPGGSGDGEGDGTRGADADGDDSDGDCAAEGKRGQHGKRGKRGKRAGESSREDGGESSGEDGDPDERRLSGVPAGSSKKVQEPLEEEDGDLSFRERIRRMLQNLKPEDYCEFWGEAAEDDDEAEGREIFDFEQLSVIEEVAVDLNLWPFVVNGPGSSASSSSKSQPSLVRHRTKHLEDISGSGVIVFNLKDFAKDVSAKLQAIPLGGDYQFPKGLSQAQRHVIHLIANQMGLWTQSEGKGTARHVSAFNMGDLADQIRKELSELKPGNSKSFPVSFTAAQRKMVHLIASDLQFKSYSSGKGDERFVEVFNFTDFAWQAREKLMALGANQEHSFPQSLSEHERKIVHCIAEELGLSHTSQGEGKQRFVAVANLHDFRREVCDILESLEPGGTHAFANSLTTVQRKVVHETATEFEYKHKSQGRGARRLVTVTRPREDGGDSAQHTSSGREGSKQLSEGSKQLSARRLGSKDAGEDEDERSEAGDEEEEEEEEMKIEDVFSMYASGEHRGKKLFVCPRDLNAFLEDIGEVLPQKKKQRTFLEKNLTRHYEDTIQLQVDFGTRTRKGLNLKWFQVFVHKAAREAGFSTMCLLMGLLDDIAEDDKAPAAESGEVSTAPVH